MDLQSFLETKPLYYDRIDLERMPAAYAEVKDRLRPGRVIHLIGTNGKGSTGRMLAEMLRTQGTVGHYSSPHILRFNERIWIDGADASDNALEAAHEKLRGWLRPQTAEALSYFEYTTLLALVAFEGCDFVVLEAGLGGEFDATSVVPREFTVVTPIGLDHQAFLGESVEEIAATKLRSIEKRALLAPQPYAKTLEVAKEIAAQKGCELLLAEEVADETMRRKIDELSRRRGWPPFLRQNALTAATAFVCLTGAPVPWKRLERVRLRGRFEKVAPNVLLDVGHNPLGARAVREALKGKRAVLVYNALSDKDVGEILAILAPVAKRVEIVPIESDRAMARKKLEAVARSLGLRTASFKGIDPDEEYLVFGSFVVAEAFLKRYGTAD